MGVDTQRLRSIHEAAWLNYGIDNDAVIVEAADEIDALRVERNQLAHALVDARMGMRVKHPGDPCDNTMEKYCMDCRKPSGNHIPGCPVGLAERITQGGA